VVDKSHIPRIVERSQRVFDMQWKDGAKATLTLCFDDGFKRAYELTRDLLSKYGIHATYFVPTAYVGKKFHSFSVVSWRDLRQCIDARMEVGSHSMTHCEYTTSVANKICRVLSNLRAEESKLGYVKYIVSQLGKMTMGGVDLKCPDHQVESEITLSKQIIESELSPYRVSSFAYPKGSFNDKSKRLVMKAGYSSARTTLVGLNNPGTIDLYALKCNVWRHYTTLSAMNKWVDRALDSGSWLIELFHLVTDAPDCTPEACALDQIRAHLDYATDNSMWIDTQHNVASYVRQVTGQGDPLTRK